MCCFVQAQCPARTIITFCRPSCSNPPHPPSAALSPLRRFSSRPSPAASRPSTSSRRTRSWPSSRPFKRRRASRSSRSASSTPASSCELCHGHISVCLFGTVHFIGIVYSILYIVHCFRCPCLRCTFRFLYLFTPSADDKTLDSYNIAAGATIHMVLQLRGGSR